MSDRLVLEVTNNKTFFVEGGISGELYQAFKRHLGWRPEGFHWAIRKYVEKVEAECRRKGYDAQRTEQEVERARSWDGYQTDVCYNAGSCHCYRKKQYTHFSTGLLSNARQFLDKWGVKYELIDARSGVPPKTLDITLSENFEFRDYQADARDKSCHKKRGIIKCATGGGKTAIAASVMAELGVGPFVFYVTSIDLLTQAKESFEAFMRQNGVPLQVGAVGGGKKDIRDITVMTVQTAVRALGGNYEKYDDEEGKDDETDISDIRQDLRDLIRSAKGFMADEVQHWAASTCQTIADASEEAYYRFGLSATPWRDLGDDIMIDACFGRPIVDISASFLIQRGYLMKPEIFFLNVPMRGCPYSSYPKIYQFMKEHRKRNEWIVKVATNFYQKGRIPLILVKHLDHGKLLEEMIGEITPDVRFMSGKISGKKRKKHLDLMRERKGGITIATNIFDEGVDVKPLDTIVLAGSGKSQTRAHQRIGRILRPFPSVENNQKKNVIAIDFNDEVKYLGEHADKRRAMYASEPEFVIKDLKL